MRKCPRCESEERQHKIGFTAAGSQRYKCQECGCKYTPEPKPIGYPEELRQQAARMYLDGLNFRRIGRLLGVDHVSVMNWVNAVKLFVYAFNRRQLARRRFPGYPLHVIDYVYPSSALPSSLVDRPIVHITVNPPAEQVLRLV